MPQSFRIPTVLSFCYRNDSRRAIGYVDAAYVDSSVKALSYDGVKYSIAAVVDGKYPVYTFGRMFTKGEPKGAVKAFIDYVTSAEFQNVNAEKQGFVPITKMKK
jgi:phosphate transport system substrate-binding protein